MSIAARMFAVALPLAIAAGFVLAADGEKERPLDRQLLQDLNSRAMDDLDRELFGPPESKPKEPAQTKPGQAEDLEKEIAKQLGRAAVSGDENPVLEIARQMQRVEGLLREAESGPSTQELQQKIVADLDSLLEQAKKNCAGGQCNSPSEAKKPGAKKKPSGSPKPSNKPTATGAKTSPKSDPNAPPPPNSAEQDAADRAALLEQIWGELPESQRKQMQQLPTDERFLPKYELQIEQYYRRLLDQGRTDDR